MKSERGQAVIEMGVVMIALLLFSGGALDFGRCIYQYNLVQAAAGYGARWASVVGGVCGAPDGSSTTDWCNQEGGSATSFWAQSGTVPLQTNGATCPTQYDPNFSGYYTASNFRTGEQTTIVGALARHYDTSSASWNLVRGDLTPGLDLTKLKVCVQLQWDAGSSRWVSLPGSKVTVFVYYTYQPVTFLRTLQTINLVGSASYRID
jgi:Flp pilus assembly protein TadG